MKILLLGCQGQVGWELQRSLSLLGPVFACDRSGSGISLGEGRTVDFTQPQAVVELVREFAPDVIVNAAAYTAVDRAEADVQAARLVNATVPGLLAQEALRSGALLVHYSTDYVFDGSGSQPRDEQSVAAPLNVYGQTKLEGEQAIQASQCRHLILRTSWVYAARGGNFVRTILRLAGQRDFLEVVDDQIGAPTGADLLADATALAIRSVLGGANQAAREDLLGLYHLVADGQTSWHGYATQVLQWARDQGMAIQVDPANVKAVATTSRPATARRPLNSRLDTHKFRQAFGLHLPHWQLGVTRLLHEIHSADQT